MREEFPIFERHPKLVYLDSAATAQKPYCVIDAINQFYSENYATVHRAIYQHAQRASDAYHETRVAAAHFLHAKTDEIIFTRGTTDGINLVAQSYGKTFVNEGDEIVVSEMEHHSNLIPWQMLAKEKKANLRIIPIDDDGVLQWEGIISEKTKIVALAHVSNVTGTINPIAEIAQEAHIHGAVLVVDGAQAAPHMRIDVEDLGCDFYAFSGHKCYGPTGVGVLFAKKEHLEFMPPIQGGGDMIENVELKSATYQKGPMRFEAGTPMIASVIALKAALEFVQRATSCEPLLKYATERLKAVPDLKIIGNAPEKGPIITFHIEGIHPLDIASLLDLKQICIRSGHLCAQPLLKRFSLPSFARVSFGAYNTIEEVDLFVDELGNIAKQLKGPALSLPS